MSRNFKELLGAQWEQGKFVCLGLDSEFEKIPQALKDGLAGIPNYNSVVISVFNRKIVQATKDIVCAYKLNIAFYEAEGLAGLEALASTVSYIHQVAPEIPVILDAKRADIGNTNNGYVKAAFDFLGVDAITVSPYLGAEALQPFLGRAEKGIIVLCRTSNPGAGEFQDLAVGADRLYQVVAERVAKEWNKNNNCGLVVGATTPEELSQVRRIVGDLPILVPGVGAQGGDVEKTVRAGLDSRGQGIIINSSRGIIFASSGADFADKAREKTLELHQEIAKVISEIKKGSRETTAKDSLTILKMGQDELSGLKSEDIHRFLSPEEVVHMARTLGAFWTYDYQAARQGRVGLHALLKSGLHSDGFFVSRILLAGENIRQIISNQIAMRLREVVSELDAIDYAAGVPDGATKIGEDISKILGVKNLKMQKVEGRISPVTPLNPGERTLIIEDFCTRGTGFTEAVQVIMQAQPKVHLLPYDPVILNRGGLGQIVVEGVGEFAVLPVVEWRVQDWPENECPLCAMGSMPIKPKETDENWQKLINSQK